MACLKVFFLYPKGILEPESPLAARTQVRCKASSHWIRVHNIVCLHAGLIVSMFIGFTDSQNVIRMTLYGMYIAGKRSILQKEALAAAVFDIGFNQIRSTQKRISLPNDYLSRLLDHIV